VVDAMQHFAALTVQAREALLAGDAARFGKLINANFDLRRSICRLPAGQVEMIERARQAGATAAFPGSGGAIVGTFPDAATYARLQAALAEIRCRVVRPQVGPNGAAPA
jgi:glucuronokinase